MKELNYCGRFYTHIETFKRYFVQFMKTRIKKYIIFSCLHCNDVKVYNVIVHPAIWQPAALRVISLFVVFEIILSRNI